MVKLTFWLLALAVLAPTTWASADAEDAPPELTPPVIPEDLVGDLVLPSASRPIPFKPSERLDFKLGWGMFKVAKASLTTETIDYQDTEALHFTLQTKTRGFINAVYPVDNHSWSWTDVNMERSFGYETDQNEGGDHRQRKTTIDWSTQTAHFKDLKTEEMKDPVMVLEGTFDPLSIVYYVRTLDFEVGDRLVVPTTNGKEFFFTIINVTKKVTRKFLSGTHEAYVIEPKIKDLGGVFKKSKDGKVVFYFSADEYKFPLRLESEVTVGSFWAEMTEAEVNGERIEFD